MPERNRIHTPYIVWTKLSTPIRKAAPFSNWDANGGYWQVEVKTTISRKAAFTAYHRLYTFVTTLFSSKLLRNVPTRDGRYNVCVKLQFALVYSDRFFEFLLWSCDLFVLVKQISSLFRETGVILKLKKCISFTRYLTIVPTPNARNVWKLERIKRMPSNNYGLQKSWLSFARF